MYILLFVILALSRCSYAWTTCEEQDFCNNIRYDLLDEIKYSLTSIELASDVTGDVINDKNSDQFKFRLVALQSETVRFTIQDLNKPRFTPEADALDGDPIETSFSLVRQEENLCTLKTEEGLIVYLYTNPFKIEVEKDGEIIIVVNQNNRLIINTSEEDRSLAVDISFPIAQRVYGIPQHAERLSLPSTGVDIPKSAFRMFNVDYYGYPPFTREGLYGSIGILYGISTTITSGIFWMNAAQTFVDVNNKLDGVDSLFISETGALELFMFGGPTLKDCVRQFTTLTGVGELPQYFSLGYHQSRYSYMSQEDVETVVEEFDNHDFPMDAIWLDIDYTLGYRYFTWDYDAFPNPIEMQNNVAATGRKMVAINDPHIKVEEGYFVYDEALANDFFVKYPNETVFEGLCWPDMSSYIDFFDKDAQEWYGDLYSLTKFPDTTLDLYVWNDMNEPSVFEADDQTMPGNVMHAGGWEHRDVHNLYGFKQTQATKGGLLRRDPNARPFILTRAHFAGSQRYAAMWTGDNSPTWEHLQISIPMVLTESLAGMAFCGADVGGFTDNVADDLLQRWYQVGSWYPFFRGHSGADTDRREPYLMTEEVQERIREAIRIRYRHLPYWYKLFFEHERTGDPIARPLSYHYPQDSLVLDTDNQWLIGSDIMVAPVIYEDVRSIRTYFPGSGNDLWFNPVNELAYLGNRYYDIPVDMNSAPYYYRGGSIILRIDENVQNTQQQSDLAYSIYICLDSNSEASGTFYLDDLVSFDYKNTVYIYYRFIYENNNLRMEQIDEDANFNTNIKISNIYVYSLSNKNRALNTFAVNGVAVNKTITSRDMRKRSAVIVSFP